MKTLSSISWYFKKIIFSFGLTLTVPVVALAEAEFNTWYAGTSYQGVIVTSGVPWNCSGGTCVLSGPYGQGLNMAVCKELSRQVGGLEYYYNESGMIWSKSKNRALLDQCNGDNVRLVTAKEAPGFQAISLTTPIQRTDNESPQLAIELLRFNGPPYSGSLAAKQSTILTLLVDANAPYCKRQSLSNIECDVILYSGGRPAPGISMKEFRQQFAMAIDEVDIAMELQTADGRMIARSTKEPAGATPGYMQVIVASKLAPGTYRVLVSSAKRRGRFSVLWSAPLGD